MSLYYKHMLSSSSLCKNKEVLARNGGGKFGKEMCFCTGVSGSTSRSWTWHPLRHLNLGWEIHLSLIFPSSNSYLGSSLSQFYQDQCRVIHMFKRSPNKPSFESSICIVISYHVGLPCVSFNSFSYFDLPLICYLFHVIHGGYIKALLWRVFFLSTSTHHPGKGLRNHLVP